MMRLVVRPLPFIAEGEQELRLEIDSLEQLRQSILEESRSAPESSQEALRRELAAVEEQLERLRQTLERRVMVVNTGLTVAVGSEVTVETEQGRQTFTIVGPAFATPRKGCISYESPLGQALVGAELGDWVEEIQPDGSRRKMRIAAISRGRLPEVQAEKPVHTAHMPATPQAVNA